MNKERVQWMRRRLGEDRNVRSRVSKSFVEMSEGRKNLRLGRLGAQLPMWIVKIDSCDGVV